jgi:Holliday junction resolvase RusA-like endonuclease
MPDEITITVHGQPAPQGSKRAFAVRGKGGVPTGRVAVVESSHDRVKSWRQAVVDEARGATGWGETPPLEGPLEAEMEFRLARPKAHYRTGRNAHLLRDGAPPAPAGMPDLSKLARATEDALTGLLWRDDAQVVTYTRLAKVYAPVPGAVITVRRLP